MEKVHKSQLVKAAFLLLLLLLIPFVSTSMRPSYLYLLLNILILSLGIEAGFLTAMSGHSEDKKPPIASAAAAAATASPPADLSSTGSGSGEFDGELAAKMSAVTDRIVAGAARAVNKVKRCPSVPSLFFIGCHEIEGDKDVGSELEEEEEVILKGVIREEPSGQELFAKAETFISNFYKQLKMQREESLRRIHGLLSQKKTRSKAPELNLHENDMGTW